MRRRTNRKLLSEEQLEKYFGSEDCEDSVFGSGESRDGFMAGSGESEDDLSEEKPTKSTHGNSTLSPNNAREVPETDLNLANEKVERGIESLIKKRKALYSEEPPSTNPLAQVVNGPLFKALKPNLGGHRECLFSHLFHSNKKPRVGQ